MTTQALTPSRAMRQFTKFQYQTVMHFCQKKRNPNLDDLEQVLNELDGGYGRELMILCKSLITDNSSKTERQTRIEYLASKYTGPVYYSFWGRDCDLCESTSAREFESEFEAQEYIKQFEWNAEGPCSATKITKQQYDEFQPFFHDYAAELAGY